MFIDDSLVLEKANRLPLDFIPYIEKVEWGFETGVRYLILNREPMLNSILPLAVFHLLRRNKQLIGTVMSLQKKISLGNGDRVEANYISLLSVLPAEQGHGHAKALVQAADSEGKERKLNYAYIEDKNIPSAAVFKALGYERVGQFLATTFNRFVPKRSRDVARLQPENTEFIKRQLSELYSNHAFLDLDASFHGDPYWVRMENGKIIAGAQVEEEFWSITSMPGPDGWFALKVLPYFPLLNKILNPKRLPIIKIANLYVAEGREKEFMELISHLTCQYHKKLALAYLDPRSLIYRRLRKTQWFGLFNSFFETPVNIWARFQGFNKAELAALKDRPFVISPLDIS
jgi:RimJ/RimL family protein N-acetyltransferase